ncbi:MAG: 3-oxoadipate enol-lactonase [Pseudomonadota bacterium]
MKVLKINGAHIAYRHRPGLGRTIVFANSLGSDQSIWDEVIAAIPGGYGILTYDLRGHGHSNGTAVSIEGLADDLSQLIDALDLRDILFCGVSIGGMIGQVLTAKRADVIRAAVLCNTAPQIGSADRWQTRIDAVTEHGVAGIASDILSAWFGATYANNSDRLALHQAMIARTGSAGYIAACKAIRDVDLRETTAQIARPTLCIGGSEDQSVPPDSVRALANRIPEAEVNILPGVGHLPCLEVPETLAGLLTDFDPPETDASSAGTATRRKVLGDAHVARADANTTPLDSAFQTLITSGAWGQVWASPGISARDRSMLTLALLAATGNFEEIPMHIRASRRTGATERDITEAFQHVAIYAGVPRANHALKLAKATFAEMQQND